jgi:acyl dehydratase
MAEPGTVSDAPAVPIASLTARIGEEIGVSDWILVDQSRIDVFADCTEDRQWIHVDPQAAAASPFGGTIAHGFLSLSLLAPMSYSAVPQVEKLINGVNYGFNTVRFLAPVRAGKRVRGRFVLKDLVEQAPGRWQIKLDASVEIEGEAKPALIAEWMFLYFVGEAG